MNKFPKKGEDPFHSFHMMKPRKVACGGESNYAATRRICAEYGALDQKDALPEAWARKSTRVDRPEPLKQRVKDKARKSYYDKTHDPICHSLLVM